MPSIYRLLRTRQGYSKVKKNKLARVRRGSVLLDISSKKTRSWTLTVVFVWI